MDTPRPIATNSLFCETAGFQPFITDEEICLSLKTVSHHLDAVIPKGRNAWEVVFKSEEVAFGLEVTGIMLCGQNIELGQRFPGGIPLDTGELVIRQIF